MAEKCQKATFPLSALRRALGDDVDDLKRHHYFAGSSTQIAEGNAAYAETVGKTAAMQRNYDGKQPGDPERAAQAIIAVSSADKPPLRLVLGRDAYTRAEQTDEARLAELRAWRETSVSTDFPAADD